ncbi:putative odorant receptor 92a [Chironomus tepperi]|uniref:putative odorant receptor 92a n=1 Tax=Chironomus tepperi TaxID=113505 RepID=UPI00391F58EE
MLKDSSEGVTDGIYSCGWEDLMDKKLKLSVLMNNERIFPFHVIFPFDATPDHLYYPIVLWIGVSHSLPIALIIGNHNILYGFIALFSLEFNILKTKFEKLKDLKPKEFAKNLKSCVDRQNELANCVELFQDVFSTSFCFEFVSSSFIICFTAFQLSTSTDGINLTFNFLFCLYSLKQIFILCFFGQMLIDASQEVVDVIYNCGWEDLEVGSKKSILLTLIRAQKTSQLSVLNILTISLNQFEMVIKTTYSYFTLCQHLSCLTAFQCSMTTEATKFIFNIAFFASLFMEIALQSLFGQMLLDSHNDLRESIYSCQWEQKIDPKFRKSIILMLANIQKQEVFKIAKILDISLGNVTSVLASTSSYYTLCRQVYTKS